jgi:hypothetical protein
MFSTQDEVFFAQDTLNDQGLDEERKMTHWLLEQLEQNKYPQNDGSESGED